MAGILPTSTAADASSKKSKSSTDAINDIDMGTFLTLMIKELQNQDPLNPLENKDMLAQISQIRSVGATDKLTQTLDSVLLGQNISSATNLIGAEVDAISEDNEKVTGVVDRVSIDKGTPKLHIENQAKVDASGADGDIEKGKYAYRVVWDDSKGNRIGLDFSGSKGIETTGVAGVDRAITLSNLPATATSKQVYRTDNSGTGAYKLVGTIVDGDSGSFTDTMSDAERSNTQLTGDFFRSDIASRNYSVTLNNISAIRPPAVASASIKRPADITNN
jgi:flagellar basal-body rod modification protein FlgD